MNPLPSQNPSTGKPDGGGMPSLPTLQPSSTGDDSAAIRPATPACFSQRAYPWLLCASTAVAASFCLLYITKPVIIPAPAMTAPTSAGKSIVSSPASSPSLAASESSATPDLIPSRDALPGENPADSQNTLPGPPPVSAFEETNLRVQHVLTAEAPGGHLDRIILDVPVLYRSRELRWTADEVAEARNLLVQLMNYQEKCRALHSEGSDLVSAWNRLIEQSLPAAELRADSPSLPANQRDAADTPKPAGLISSESIQIRSSGK